MKWCQQSMSLHLMRWLQRPWNWTLASDMSRRKCCIGGLICAASTMALSRSQMAKFVFKFILWSFTDNESSCRWLIFDGITHDFTNSSFMHSILTVRLSDWRIRNFLQNLYHSSPCPLVPQWWVMAASYNHNTHTEVLGPHHLGWIQGRHLY